MNKNYKVACHGLTSTNHDQVEKYSKYRQKQEFLDFLQGNSIGQNAISIVISDRCSQLKQRWGIDSLGWYDYLKCIDIGIINKKGMFMAYFFRYAIRKNHVGCVITLILTFRLT